MDSFSAAFGDSAGIGSNGNGASKVGVARIDDNASAASRQKSCNACVRGKRKCDKRTPQCSRCSAKGLDCVYQKLPPGSTRSSSPNASISANGNSNDHSATSASDSAKPPVTSAVPSQGSCAYPSASTASSSCVSDMPEFDMSFDMDSLGTATETSPESLHDSSVPLGGGGANGALDFSIVELMASSGGEQDLWNLHSFAEPGSKMDIPPLTMPPHSSSHEQLQQTLQHPPPQQMEQQLQLQPLRDLSLLKDPDAACMDIDPIHVHDPNTRVGYIMAFLNSMHTTFSRTRALPFMHPRLWADQLPKPILSAFSASSAHAALTAANKGWTVRLLMDSAREIHREGERASTNMDKLARVQAMLILNSMRIFDGDLALRAAAEREMHVLLTWVKELDAVKNELEAEHGFRAADGLLREKPPKTWDSWVFLECTRRSILTASCIMCLVHMLKGNDAGEDLWCAENTFTASRHLWDATTSGEFYRAWREKPQFLITNMVFKEFWMYGRSDDCDEFTRLMFTAAIGVEAAESFMSGEDVSAGKMARGP